MCLSFEKNQAELTSKICDMAVGCGLWRIYNILFRRDVYSLQEKPGKQLESSGYCVQIITLSYETLVSIWFWLQIAPYIEVV